jgi:tetratricopeptide (TPR) repeat protein
MADDAPTRTPEPLHPQAERARDLFPSDDGDPFGKWLRKLLPGGGDPTTGDPSTPPDVPSAEEPAPVAVGRYAIRGELARGGMGVVYRAHDPLVGRDVAVKLMRGWTRSLAPAARRFLDEARITGQLQHPGIPPVHEIGELPDGSPFLVMKLIKGRTLAELVRDRPDPAADRGRDLGAFERVCEAVAYAHAHGVIHRDLKPANVMVGAFGEVQVMDWGLAKVVGRPAPPGARPAGEPPAGTEIRGSREADGSVTEAGSMMGTPAYMPPEQAGGEVEKIDARADVFGLGAILAVLLTGQPPYVAGEGEDVRLMAVRGQLAGCLARLAACGADPALVELCRRCLAFAPGDRPADAGAVAAAVRQLRADAEERARQAELDRVRAEGKAVEQRKRRRVQLALLGAVGVILLGGGAVAWWQDKEATARHLETENRERAKREQADRNAEALTALLTVGEESLRAGDVGKAETAFAEAGRRVDDEVAADLRGRLGRGRADLTALAELNAIDQFRWSPNAGRYYPDEREVLPRWRPVFERIGAVPGQVSADVVAKRVTDSPIRVRLLGALDRWLGSGRSADVRAVLRAADPDSFRGAVRDATLAGDVTGVAALAARAEALTQPSWFAVVLGGKAEVPVERRRALLLEAVRRYPEDLAVLMTLGESYPLGGAAGVADRLRWFQSAVGVAPRNPAAHVNLGGALYDAGDLIGAIAAYEEASRLDPTYTLPRYNLGVIRLGQREYVRAIALFKEAIALNPQLVPAYNNLGAALLETGDLDGAIAEYRKAIGIGSENSERAWSHFNLGLALQLVGDLDGAIQAFQSAIRIDARNAEAPATLAWILAAGPDGVRDGKRAVEYATRACELSAWGNPNHVAILAAAYAEAGNFVKAVEYQRKALTYPERDKEWGKIVRAHLARYERSKPSRDPTLFQREVAPPPRSASPRG